MVKQLGVGQGTVERLRRPPRVRVADVEITEATGATLGPDGYYHPLETTEKGELKITERSAVFLLEEILMELRQIHNGLLITGVIPTE